MGLYIYLLFVCFSIYLFINEIFSIAVCGQFFMQSSLRGLLQLSVEIIYYLSDAPFSSLGPHKMLIGFE